MMLGRSIFALLLMMLVGCQHWATNASGSARPANPHKAAKIYLKMGQQYWQQGNVERAGERLYRAVELAPDWGEAVLVLADWQAQHAEPQQAIASYQRALALLGDDGLVHNRLGVFHCQQQQLGLANAAFTAAVSAELNAQVATAYTNQALCYQQLQPSGYVDALYQKLLLALQADPYYPPALLLYTQLAWQSQQYGSAAEYWQRYTQRVPLSQMSLTALQIGQNVSGQQQDWASYAQYQQAANALKYPVRN